MPRLLKRLILTLAGTLLAAGPALAHETVVKPGAEAAAPGKGAPFGVHSAHVFIESEELEAAPDVKAFVFEGGKLAEVALKANEKGLTYDGQAVFAKPGTGIVYVHRLPQVWSLTPEGLKKGTKKELPGATKSNRYEKFAKGLVAVGGATAGFDALVGARLELVPLTDPAKAKVGEDLPVKVLLDGQPMPATVLATYDGFTKNPNTYAYYTETDDSGVAKVRLTHAGLWLVRTEAKAVPADGSADQEVLRSTLTFFVK
ncbi:MAG: ABC-type Co2+ transport system, periplasmic component [Solidesulfovibrio magneticus str. Maddingley MBC34]|uniref:ABC-type Co2+ transport system, periplasmic component n=1 Tax=Solidesulfovibrio magneticus str. Maddingley MBC34 TaxID=1206767 RepID=K6G9X7_9BACT|nr:MAG: ABC-type Co2+ transport system, periplasmic component [Solidesulfovibrio magneticus str. Maddingley MBC34]